MFDRVFYLILKANSMVAMYKWVIQVNEFYRLSQAIAKPLLYLVVGGGCDRKYTVSGGDLTLPSPHFQNRHFYTAYIYKK